MTTLLIAGASGYLGRAIALGLRDRFGIVALSRRPELAAARLAVPWADYADDDAILAALPAGEEVVIVDCAGESRESRMGMTAEGNYGAMERLIGLGRKLPLRRLVFFSGYGTGMPTTSAYFAAKTAAEALLARSGLPWISLRASYIVGGADEIFLMVVEHARATGRVEYPGSGAYRIQPIHVEDVAALTGAIAAGAPLADGPHDLLGEPIAYRDFLARLVAGLPLTLASTDLERCLAEATVGADAPLSLDQLAILVCDKVGPPTRTLAGVRLRPLDLILAQLAAEWRKAWNAV